jgi:hypothetical protein
MARSKCGTEFYAVKNYSAGNRQGGKMQFGRRTSLGKEQEQGSHGKERQ